MNLPQGLLLPLDVLSLIMCRHCDIQTGKSMSMGCKRLREKFTQWCLGQKADLERRQAYVVMVTKGWIYIDWFYLNCIFNYLEMPRDYILSDDVKRFLLRHLYKGTGKVTPCKDLNDFLVHHAIFSLPRDRTSPNDDVKLMLDNCGNSCCCSVWSNVYCSNIFADVGILLTQLENVDVLLSFNVLSLLDFDIVDSIILLQMYEEFGWSKCLDQFKEWKNLRL